MSLFTSCTAVRYAHTILLATDLVMTLCFTHIPDSLLHSLDTGAIEKDTQRHHLSTVQVSIHLRLQVQDEDASVLA